MATANPILLVIASRDEEALNELAGAAHAAADDSARISALVFTPPEPDLERRLRDAGVSACYVAAVDQTLLSDEYLLHVLEHLSGTLLPYLVVMTGGTGAALAARLAHRVAGTFISACCAIERRADGALLCTRPSYGGRTHDVLEATARPLVVTLKAKAFAAAPVKRSAHLEVKPLEAPPFTPTADVVRVETAAPRADAVDLADAKIIVSGGRGLGSADGFTELARLADQLGGVVGGSRAAVDMGWISHASQVGQTGTTVAPELYIAIGISGAVQHVSGMSASRHVVAINTDEEAPIFSMADVAVVADYREFLPEFMEALQARARRARAA